MRYIGMDYGSKTIGISVSDESLLVANGVSTIRFTDEDDKFKQISNLIDEYKPSKIILGNPINLDGSESTRSLETKEFKKQLESLYDIPIILQDERYSTVSVHKMLIDNKTRRDKRKKVVDKLASSIILQSYLDKENYEKKQYNNSSK